MQVLLDPNASSAVEAKTKIAQPPAPGETQKTTPTQAAAEQVSEVTKTPAASELLQANVTFRRDPSGQIYYVVTDPNSGKEIREVPAEEIRKVGEGIQEYLKQEEAKSSPHVEVKA